MLDIAPLPEESVWDYPRPPKLERVPHRLRVVFDGVEIANSASAHRIVETSHPPTYYIPQQDIRMDLLTPATGSSFCEFKGRAVYWSVKVDELVSSKAAWSYPLPSNQYADICDAISFYANRVSACFVGDQEVEAQEGDFYGGWITPNLKGPFKGGAGTWGW